MEFAAAANSCRESGSKIGHQQRSTGTAERLGSVAGPEVMIRLIAKDSQTSVRGDQESFKNDFLKYSVEKARYKTDS